MASACTDDAVQNNTHRAATTDGGLSAVQNTKVQFVERASELGLVFQHYSGATGHYHMPEILGSGVALLDFDNDGDLDVFLVQSTDLDRTADGYDKAATVNERREGLHEPLWPLPAGQPPGNRMFANRLADTGQLKFEDVTDRIGLQDTVYGMGVAVSDYDNDGDLDIYVAAYGANALYQNNQGSFKKIPDAAGGQDTRWSSSATFCDINKDQWPDLYVANYIIYAPEQKVVCRDTLGQEDYCSPRSYTAAPDSVFVNRGDGTFANAGETWGVTGPAGAGLGVLCRDLNQDGFVDIYVANDSMPNNLWINDRGQRLLDNADVLGAALNINGLPEGSMGVTAGDFDFDGDDDLFLTHWNNETNTLYRNDLQRGFLDITTTVNLASPSFAHTGFGSDWLDFDNDGDLDLFVANGAVQRYIRANGQVSQDYAQKNQLWRNDGLRFSDLSDTAFDTELRKETSRGAAFGDIDNDGDTDIVVTNKDGPVRLYINHTTTGQWLGLKLVGQQSNQNATGAIVKLTLPDGRQIRRVVRRDGSYQSAHDPRVIIGLGALDYVPDVEISWPAGGRQRLKNLTPRRYHSVMEPGDQSLR